MNILRHSGRSDIQGLTLMTGPFPAYCAIMKCGNEDKATRIYITKTLFQRKLDGIVTKEYIYKTLREEMFYYDKLVT